MTTYGVTKGSAGRYCQIIYCTVYTARYRLQPQANCTSHFNQISIYQWRQLATLNSDNAYKTYIIMYILLQCVIVEAASLLKLVLLFLSMRLSPEITITSPMMWQWIVWCRNSPRTIYNSYKTDITLTHWWVNVDIVMSAE